ncbi:MAG: biopolymer transporter ExbD [Proteobacteria bacterium]|nr:biopolymer transporter ExbD [Pseudomonadota bacterium]
MLLLPNNTNELGFTKRAPNLELNLISFIDVNLMLFVFFVLAGRLEHPDPIPVNPPTAQTGVASHDAQQVLVISKDGDMLLNGVIVNDKMILPLLKKAYKDGDKALTLKVDAALPASILTKIIRKLQDAGVKDIALVTEPR